MARSKIYPWDCLRLSLHFHPFSWRLGFWRHGVGKPAEWFQQKGVTRWWFKVGPFTVSQDFLI